jgi:hypothetical protein
MLELHHWLQSSGQESEGNKMNNSYIAEIETNVAGIPCVVGVTRYNKVRGDARADSEMDYYGYTESEYVVCDRRGRPAPWLERKVSEKDTDRIETAIAEYFNG